MNAVIWVVVGWAMLSIATPATATGQEQARAGAQVVMTMCTACHGVKYVQYGDLAALTLSADEIDALRGERSLRDTIQSLTSDGDAQLAYGMVPPDLSLIVAARDGGGGFLRDYLMGYYLDEFGQIQNRVYPGTRMPDIFGISAVDDPAYRADIERSVDEVIAFLEWTADPNKRKREAVGYVALGYLVLLTAMLYLAKRRVWAGLKRLAPRS